jgi:hypothetical protein
MSPARHFPVVDDEVPANFVIPAGSKFLLFGNYRSVSLLLFFKNLNSQKKKTVLKWMIHSIKLYQKIQSRVSNC